MIKVYLASRYARREEMEKYARRLQKLGVEIVSRWVWGSHSLSLADGQDLNISDPRNGKLAREDREDVLEAGIVLNFTESDLFPRGSRQTEFGMAYESYKICVIVGPFENLFHHLPGVLKFETFEEVIQNWDIVLTSFPSKEKI